MVREIRYEVDFPQCTPKELFDAVFADDVAIKLYHKLNSAPDCQAKVTPWTENERIVEFSKEIQLPEPLSSIFGSTRLPVKEFQTLDRPDEETFTISSILDMRIGIGPKLSGTTRLTARLKNGGCKLSVLIRCEASGPWGMTGMIENHMVKEASDGIRGFLIFSETRVAESKLLETAAALDDEDSVSFYDVRYESLSQCSSPETATQETPRPLSTEAVILNRIRQLEDELRLCQQELGAITQRVLSLENALSRSRYTSFVALSGCTALSFALIGTVLVLKR